MRDIIKNHLLDTSTGHDFGFSIRCSDCGREIVGQRSPFSRASALPEMSAKRLINQKLYEIEWARALEEAVSVFANHLNVCPLCKRIVCNHCFIICDETDICRTCSGYLQLPGVAVEDAPLGDPATANTL